MTKKEFSGKFLRNSMGKINLKHITTAEKIVDVFLDTMKEELEKGETLIFRDFGIFKVRQHKRTDGRNPATGEAIKINPKKYVKFKTGKDLSEKINKR